MIQAYAAQVDRNFVDAWNNGGEVDGKKVNDTALIAHFKKRRDELPKTDPVWDEWDNRITQYTFSIEESKMRVKWDNEKVTQAQMAAFYRGWEKKATPNSEFQRTLASNAGKWAADARAKGRAGASRRKGDADANAMKAIYDAKYVPAKTLENNLLELGRRAGFTTQGAASLGEMQAGMGHFGRLLEIIEDGVASDPDLKVMIDDLVKQQRAFNPNFTLTEASIMAVLDDGIKGAKQLEGFDQSEDQKKGWKNGGRGFGAVIQRVDGADTMTALVKAKKDLIEDINDARGDPGKIDALLGAYEGKVQVALDDIAGAGLEADAGLFATLNAHQNDLREGRLTGKFSEAALSSPFDSTDWNTNSKANDDAEGLRVLLANNFVDMQAVKGGGWAELVPQIGADGQVILKPNGQPEYAYKFHGPDVAPPYGYEAVSVSKLGDGSPVQVFGAPQPVMAALPANMMGPQGTPIVIGPDGQPLMAEGGRSGKGASNTPTPANPIVAEAVTVMDPVTGNSKVIYRTGSSPSDYVYTPDLPVKKGYGLKYDGKGNMVVEVKEFDPSGAYDPLSVRDETTRDVQANGNLNKGSYFTPLVANYSDAMETLFSTAKTPAEQNVAKTKYETLDSKLVQTVQFMTRNRPSNDPELLKTSRDYSQFTAVAPLWAAGKPEAEVDADYKAVTAYTSNDFWRMKALTHNGFDLTTEAGRLEGAQRLFAHDKIAKWEQDNPINIPLRAGRYGEGWADEQQAGREGLRKDVLDPSKSIRDLKLPNMKGLFEEGTWQRPDDQWVNRPGGLRSAQGTIKTTTNEPPTRGLPNVPTPGALPPVNDRLTPQPVVEEPLPDAPTLDPTAGFGGLGGPSAPPSGWSASTIKAPTPFSPSAPASSTPKPAPNPYAGKKRPLL